LPENAKPRLTLQLSSPIEEAHLTEMYSDEQQDQASQQQQDGSSSGSSTNKGLAVFKGVETNQATLTVTASDADIPLGSSTSYDLAPMTKLDAMQIQTSEYVSDHRVAILPDTGDDDVLEAVCTVTLRITYIPSKKDQREELYELMNKANQRKAAAVQELRRLASRQAMTSSPTASGPTNPSSSSSGPAVKSGFLNKPNKTAAAKGPSKWLVWYERNLGPNSFLRTFAPKAQNYLLFVGVTVLFHFKGQLLALPPPV
jgi:hypothetical protein